MKSIAWVCTQACTLQLGSVTGFALSQALHHSSKCSQPVQWLSALPQRQRLPLAWQLLLLQPAQPPGCFSAAAGVEKPHAGAAASWQWQPCAAAEGTVGAVKKLVKVLKLGNNSYFRMFPDPRPFGSTNGHQDPAILTDIRCIILETYKCIFCW